MRRHVDGDQVASLGLVADWIPTETRPSDQVIAAKQQFVSNTLNHYRSEADYVLGKIFKFPTSYIGELRETPLPPNSGHLSVFMPNPFPYQVPAGTEHWLLWFAHLGTVGLHSREYITKHIDQKLRALVGHDRYEFIWYENPKMAMGVYHVQVFWRVLPDGVEPVAYG